MRLGESLGELIGAGERVDEEEFVDKGVTEAFAPKLIKRAEGIIEKVGEEYKAVFLAEYKRIMTLRLGLRTQKEDDFEGLLSEALDLMEGLELDLTHFFRRLSSVEVASIETEEMRREVAGLFFHGEGVTGLGNTEASARKRVAEWLERWRGRVLEDWGEGEGRDEEREEVMKAFNPKVGAALPPSDHNSPWSHFI